MQSTTIHPSRMLMAFPFNAAFGTQNGWAAGGGLHCGIKTKLKQEDQK